jgi:Sigma 54 modulation protein / S30EA ribosomal protein
MQIQVNTDGNIEGREQLADHARSVVESALDRFRDRITRVEVHISDQNGEKSGQDDKRCMMEARVAGRQPTAVTYQAATVGQALDGAAQRLAKVIESTLGRMHDEQGRRTDPVPAGPNGPENA